MISLDPAYYGREQTAVKHQLLQKYLAPAARIIGSFADCFVYIDCCSGPWNTATEDLSDTSFSIAIEELRKAREFLKTQGRLVEMRCLFMEDEPSRFARLKQFCETVTDVEVKPLQGDFTKFVPAILRFIGERRNSFPFFFIDPTGWSPLGLRSIAPLLESKPSEALIVFMTSHIKRFLESSNFETRFGPDYMRKVAGLSGQSLDDSAALSFADEIRKFYRYTCTSVVLNPLQNKTHFHMIYGTRSTKGVEKFKEAEKSCFGFMEAARLDAHKRFTGSDDDAQGKLFEDMNLPEQDLYLHALREYYQREALAELDRHRASSKAMADDTAWEIVSRFPLVWKSDLREWMKRGIGKEAANASAVARR